MGHGMSEDFRPASDEDVPAVLALWRRAGMVRPWNPPEIDITAIRANPRSALLIAFSERHLAATVVVEDGGHRAWVYYLCSNPDLRGLGWGRRAMAAAEDWARTSGHPKLQLLIRNSNTSVRSFYDALGYEESAVKVLQKWLDPEREQAFRENPDAH